MNRTMKAGLSLTVLCTALALHPVSSASGLYLGGNLGGFKARGGDFNDDRYLLEGVVGWRLGHHIAIEGNYIDFARYGGRAASADVDGFGAAVVGVLPVTDTLSLHAKGGMFWWDADIRVLDTRHGQSDNSLFYGLGATLQLTPALDLNAEYKRFEMDYDRGGFPPPPRNRSTDLDTLTMGVRFSF